VKSLVEKPMLNFQRSPLQCEDVCRVLAELHLLLAQVIIQLLASHLQVVPTFDRLTYGHILGLLNLFLP